MSTSSLFGIDSRDLKAFQRQQKYFPYRYAVVRKYLPNFVNKYQKIYADQLADFAISPSADMFNASTLQTDFYDFFTEIVCDTPGNTTYAKYLKKTFIEVPNQALNPDFLGTEIIDDENSPIVNTWRANILHELKLALAFVSFYNLGKNIFDFPQCLLESFKNTNIENIPLRDVKLPYPAFYLHFGLQKDLELELGHVVNSEFVYSLSTKTKQINRYYLEGVYVKEIASGGFELALIGSPEFPILSDNWLEYPTEALSIKIPLIDPNITIGEALDWEIIDSSASQKKAIFNYLQENNLIDKIDIDFNIELLNDFLFYEFEEFHDNKYNKFILKILKLVINAIFYITNYRLTEEISEQIPRFVPNILRKQLESDDIDTRSKALLKLDKQGYSLVKICGKRSCKTGVFLIGEIGKVDNFEQEELVSSTQPKRQFSSYHRRRHYRLCAVGKNRSEEALIWVEYAYVQGTLPSQEGLRIYEFDQPETSGTNLDNLDGKILNNKQILEIRNMFELRAATISEIAYFYRLPEEIIERIIVKKHQ
ncbi:hypothetical protein CDG77_26560 [Nostoc sp. 'Peltigera membranacea cyanobiont' 213]|uniref:hypothetical protein n=1 Tax=Nostoc sp. 'Peltigera membranacea cyanobiont' 213 TaxID=2014530 RepID=UPI000B954B55|nr:hypothetical protein [Nostoc sp. 'Peltigera membranacea cyanobiont' 213]OYD87965.1 hypothetical protein CDG77_26560 [Nostoc sp. 'Peltigera membranacea cyanobiont' 213]